jgi:hypothetical protein
MTTFANSPWFRYSALAVLGGASGYVLSRGSKYNLVSTVLGAIAAPVATIVAVYFMREWLPVETNPNLNETLLPRESAPKTGARLPDGLDPVKAKWFQGEKSGRYYAMMEHVGESGSYTYGEWWVLA